MRRVLETLFQVIISACIFLLVVILFHVICQVIFKNKPNHYAHYKKEYPIERRGTSTFVKNTCYILSDKDYVLYDYNYTPCKTSRLPYLEVIVKNDSVFIKTLSYSSYNGEIVHANKWLKCDIHKYREVHYCDEFDYEFHFWPRQKWHKHCDKDIRRAYYSAQIGENEIQLLFLQIEDWPPSCFSSHFRLEYIKFGNNIAIGGRYYDLLYRKSF